MPTDLTRILTNRFCSTKSFVICTSATYLTYLLRSKSCFRDLPVKDPTDLPDPYVKVYMLPKTKDTKRKTKVSFSLPVLIVISASL